MAAPPRLKPLDQQTIVITGASSGIGLATARMAAARGAAVVLVARNAEALDRVAQDLTGRGGRAAVHVADVGDAAQVEAVIGTAETQFGGIDSWINNAGAFVFGRTDEVSLEDHRRVFDTVYWGTVHGSLTAARALAGTGGAIVNVGSVLGDRALALQGPYSAAKHAVKGITDAFRMEFEEASLPISVTQVKPGPIDTPYVEHARNRMGTPGLSNIPPSYHPDLVARAILYACENPVRDLYVGSGGLTTTLAGALAPRLTDMIMEVVARPLQTSETPPPDGRADSLHEPRGDNVARPARSPAVVRRRSLTLELQINPAATFARRTRDTALAIGRDALRAMMNSGRR